MRRLRTAYFVSIATIFFVDLIENIILCIKIYLFVWGDCWIYWLFDCHLVLIPKNKVFELKNIECFLPYCPPLMYEYQTLRMVTCSRWWYKTAFVNKTLSVCCEVLDMRCLFFVIYWNFWILTILFLPQHHCLQAEHILFIFFFVASQYYTVSQMKHFDSTSFALPQSIHPKFSMTFLFHTVLENEQFFFLAWQQCEKVYWRKIRQR